MRTINRLIEKLQYLPEQSIKLILQAYEVAELAHGDQKRHSGEPYITHPVAVATILAEMCMDAETVMAALLHDVIEDTHVEKATLAKQFGDAVAELVDGVSKLTRIESKTSAEAQADNFHKMVMAMSRDIRVVIIKLTDRLHNMRTLGALPPHKRRRIAKETLEIYAPIANRLGMHSIANELQNLGFLAVYPERYRILKHTVERTIHAQRKMLHAIEINLRAALSRAGLNHCTVGGREKSLYHVYQKMRSRRLSFKEVIDVYGFRIITETIDDCYRALGVAHSLYKPLPERFRDYIAIPKANGYQSLHTVLFGASGFPIELQIRTKAMSQLADCGIAAHWLYSTEEKDFARTQARAQQWVKNLLEMQQKTGSSTEFIENVKIDLFPDEVYVFTPKGKIMELPRGASVIDFAYAVHSDIGNSCVAARIDRQLAPLSTELVSGQTVEIITGQNARPNPAWLDFIVTARARSGIRHYLNTQHRKESIRLGKDLLNAALKQVPLNLKKVPPTIIQKVLAETSMPSWDDLLEAIGLGHRPARLVAQQLAQDIPVSGDVEASPILAAPVQIRGTEGMVLHFASCCSPIPGDPIVGLLNEGEGLVIHQEDCKRIAKQRRKANRCIAVSWAEDIVGEFVATIKVTALNQRGVLAKLSQTIADAEGNIDDLTVAERDIEHYGVIFKIYVRNRQHLAHIIRNLHHLRSVVKVLRKVA